MEISKLEGLQVCVKEEVIVKVLLEILHKQGYISNTCYFKSIDMLKNKNVSSAKGNITKDIKLKTFFCLKKKKIMLT